MPRGQAGTAPTTPDPLADLRGQDEQPPGPPAPEVAEQAVEIRPMVTQATHDAMRAEILVAFHADTVATGTLHKGGVCGCRYLATLALRTALGEPMTAEQMAERDLDAQGAEES